MEYYEQAVSYQFQDFLKDLSISLRFIRCTFSPLLRSILLYMPESDIIVQVEGVNYKEMELLLKFLYTGEGILSQTQNNDVLKVAKLSISTTCDNNSLNLLIQTGKLFCDPY